MTKVATRPAPTKMSSRRFNQDTGAAKKLAERGPVIVTDRGRPSHVLMTFDEYRRLTGKKMTLLEALAQPEASFDFDPPRLSDRIFEPVDFD